ncbi:MAG: CRISPR-associated protein Cas4 [Aggregatilineales bacterium]|jgi:CRISPR-associated exonuclease Cas4|nr:CRISPR-associated protein Cas4 [Chloroflexota bacterium]HPV06410.1 CRISPR-associated protein Cas4 [Aggregatilineales bacterium]
MTEDDLLITVTDLKQYAYCPRIFFYHACLPDVRPTTYKMAAGIDAGIDKQEKARRRTLKAYHLSGIDGERYFDVPARCDALGLTGIVDEVIEVAGPHAEHIPVDYKLSRRVSYHFKLQLTAYAELLEATYGLPVRRGFIYLIPLRRAEEVKITTRRRDKLRTLLAEMRAVSERETMPPPAESFRRCLNCEFRRFCNDV